MKKILALTLVIVMILSLSTLLVSCNAAEEETVEDKVRTAVENRGAFEYYGSTIGGKELKSSKFSISTMTKKSDTHYVVYGSATMTDVYGTVWSNTFSCDVKYSESSESWSASNIKYSSSSWSK